MRGVLCLLLTLFAATFVCADTADEHQITNLPGIDNVPFNQYAGYINVDEAHGRNLFYWFTESQSNPKTDPLVLWLNGGPGCSSLGGLFEELGPFIPNADGETLSLNPFSWNKVANVIFLESPSGVGFSYSVNTSDYHVGDVRTANDSYNFLLQFLQIYPQYQDNPFWVTGESYGGHYVPTLSKRIIEGNAQNQQQINLKGFMAGNAWTDAPIDNAGAVFYWYSHALLSEETYAALNKYCNFSDIGPLSQTESCSDYQAQAFSELGNIDIYDIYYNVCLPSSAVQGTNLMKQLSKIEDYPFATLAKARSLTYAPCVDNYLGNYLNLDTVKAAIHANKYINWEGCSTVVQYSYTDLLSSMLPVYDFLLQQNINILVYSGDVDAIVPVTGTRAWLKVLDLPISEPWRPWTDVTGNVGGYVTVYDGLTFTTVRNAGHLVPGTQPARALHMFTNFLNGNPF